MELTKTSFPLQEAPPRSPGLYAVAREQEAEYGSDADLVEILETDAGVIGWRYYGESSFYSFDSLNSHYWARILTTEEKAVNALLLAMSKEALEADFVIANDENLEELSRALHDKLQRETFQDVQQVHDWRRYIPEATVNAWNALPVIGKLPVYTLAVQQAHAEEWE